MHSICSRVDIQTQLHTCIYIYASIYIHALIHTYLHTLLQAKAFNPKINQPVDYYTLAWLKIHTLVVALVVVIIAATVAV